MIAPIVFYMYMSYMETRRKYHIFPQFLENKAPPKSYEEPIHCPGLVTDYVTQFMNFLYSFDLSLSLQAAAGFIKQHVPTLYKTVFGLMVRYQLSDPQSQKTQKDIRSSAELNAFYR